MHDLIPEVSQVLPPLPDTVVAYLDTTIALPLLTAYALHEGTKRNQKSLYEKRPHLLSLLQQDYCARQEKSSSVS
jgi:deoxyhypusine synthase